jgi:c(7)-type cytochrome triheme protein
MAGRGRYRAAIVAALAAIAAGAAATAPAFWREAEPVAQPLRFSHATHVEGEGLECLECHAGAETQPWAGLPDIRDCYECHKSPQGEDPDEDKVREFAKRKQQIPFVQITRNAGHVYFSHRMHVTVAEMECDSCHPGYAEHDGGPMAPNPDLLSMQACMDCHDERGATNECVVCHK